MKRRISLAMAAISVCALFAVGAGIAMAASAKPKTTTLKCKMFLSTVPPNGAAQVDQPASSGRQYGPNSCAQTGYGSGMVADKFTVPISGDLIGTYFQYFRTGSVFGKFDLTPVESPPVSGTNFSSEAFKGTVTVIGGTGTLKGVKSKKGTGVMSCTSPDTVHMTCKEFVKVIP